MQPRLRVTEVGIPTKTRAILRIAHAGDGAQFIVHDNSVANARRALMERVYFREVNGQLVPPPSTSDTTWKDTCAEFRRIVCGCLPASDPKTLEEFLEGYSGDRRYERYKQAIESLGHTGIEVWDSWVRAFVKAEKIAIKPEKPDPCPRLIQPRDPRYNAALGRWLRHLEKSLYKAVKKATKAHRVTAIVAKGRNAADTATLLRECWDGLLDPICVSLDASRFDQHVSQPALRYEHSFYKWAYRRHDTSELDQLLSWQLSTKGTVRCVDGYIKYTNKGGRMSGDMNTSTGNCLLMTAMMWSWAEKATRGRTFVLDNGDDVLVMMERDDYARFTNGIEEHFTKLGFTITTDGVADVFEKIQFCQTQPVWCGDQWVMVRDPRKCLAKDLTTILPIRTSKQLRLYLGSVGKCGLSLTGGCPVLQGFYERMDQLGDGGWSSRDNQMDTGFYHMAIGMKRHTRPITPESRVSFWLAFGIQPHDQETLERYHQTWDPVRPIEDWDEPPPLHPFLTPYDGETTH